MASNILRKIHSCGIQGEGEGGGVLDDQTLINYFIVGIIFIEVQLPI